jgi:quinol monooxygenase YgiN
MKFVYGALVAAALVSAFAVAPARAQAPGPSAAAAAGPVYVVTYLEVMPTAKAEAETLLKQVAADSRKEAGNQRYDILQRTGRKNHFAILETWSDASAAEAHRNGAAMKQFRDKLTPLRTGHYDERPSVAVDVMPGPATASRGSIYVITHVDVAPPFKDQCIEMLKKLGEETRKDPNAERIDAWQQNNRANHFTVMEIWKNRQAADNHLIAASTREFREKLGPMIGALYDERYYRSLE